MKHREISMMKHLELPTNPAVQQHEQPEQDDQLKDRSHGMIRDEELI